MTFDALKQARPEIAALEPYRSARSLAAADPEDMGGWLLLDANESPFPGDAAPEQALNRYPEPQPRRLIARMARYYGVGAENILITRGSDEGIELLLRAFCRPGQDAVVICPPTFGFYGVAARIQGAEVIEVPLAGDFALDEAGVAAALKGRSEGGPVKLVFLCSPNNPTGNDMDRAAMLRLAGGSPDVVFIVDEAYGEFSDARSLAGEIAGQPNIVVLRTLSKAFGLAGIRCGALLASVGVIELLRRIIPPYPVATPVARAALQAFSPAGLARLEHDVAALRAARDGLAERLAKLEGVSEILPSSANYLLVRFADAAAAYERLAARNILVRDFSASIAGALRFTVGSEAGNAMLLQALGADAPAGSAPRRGECSRTTNETSIFAAVDLDRAADPEVSTGIGFFDHMLEQLGKHGGFALTLKCDGDLEIDAHHTVEDCMLTLGGALKDAIGDKAGLGRYGFTLPMDEAAAEAIVDLSGRACSRFEGEFAGEAVGGLPTELVPHAFRSLADSLGAAIHIRVDGENDHHKIEACFKALGRALRPALSRQGGDIPSTKGQL